MHFRKSPVKKYQILLQSLATPNSRLKVLDYAERRFGVRVHLHPVLFLKFKKYENTSKNIEKFGHKHTQVTNTCEKFR